MNTNSETTVINRLANRGRPALRAICPGNARSLARVVVMVGAASLLGLTAIGCKKPAKAAVTTHAPPSAPVELKPKWPAGLRFVATFGEQQSGQVLAPDNPVPIPQDKNMEQKYEISVLKDRAVGGSELELKLLSLRLYFKNGDSTLVDLDTARNSPDDALANAVRKAVGTKLRCLLDCRASMENLEGGDDFRARVLSGAQEDRSGLLKGMFDEKYFKRLMALNSGRTLPDHAVGPGDTWPAELELGHEGFGTMSVEFPYLPI